MPKVKTLDSSTLFLCDSITCSGNCKREYTIQTNILLRHIEDKFKGMIELDTAALRSHIITFPSYDAETKWNHDLLCHLQEEIQELCCDNWKIGSYFPAQTNSCKAKNVSVIGDLIVQSANKEMVAYTHTCTYINTCMRPERERDLVCEDPISEL